MDLQDQGVFPGRIKVRRLEDPALDLALVLGGLVPDRFHRAQLSAGKESLVDGRDHFQVRITYRADGDIAGQVRARGGDREHAVLGHGEGAAASVGTARAADAVGQFPHLALQR